MLISLDLPWQTADREGTYAEDGQIVMMTGTATSGLDLITGFMIRLRQDQRETAGKYPLQSAALPETVLRSRNRRALSLLQTWLSEPDDMGDAWWDDLEQEMRQNRLSFSEVE